MQHITTPSSCILPSRAGPACEQLVTGYELVAFNEADAQGSTTKTQRRVGKKVEPGSTFNAMRHRPKTHITTD